MIFAPLRPSVPQLLAACVPRKGDGAVPEGCCMAAGLLRACRMPPVLPCPRSRCWVAPPGRGVQVCPRWSRCRSSHLAQVAAHLLGHLGRHHLGLGGHQGLAHLQWGIQSVCLITLCKVSSHLARPLVALLLGHLHGLCDGEGGALLGGDVDALLPLHLHPTAATCHPCCW